MSHWLRFPLGKLNQYVHNFNLNLDNFLSSSKYPLTTLCLSRTHHFWFYWLEIFFSFNNHCPICSFKTWPKTKGNCFCNGFFSGTVAWLSPVFLQDFFISNTWTKYGFLSPVYCIVQYFFQGLRASPWNQCKIGRW